MTLVVSPSRRGLLALIGAAGLVGCGPGGQSRPLRIGYQRNNVPLLAKVSGRVDRALQAAGFGAPEWRLFASGPPLLEALGAGAIDIGQTGDAPPIFAQAAGAPLRYVAAIPLSGNAGGVLAPAASPVVSIADLKGRRLALTRGSSAHAQAALLLQSAGLSLADVTIVNLGPADAAAAFSRGDLDAWVIWDPFFTSALRQQSARLIPAPPGAFRSAAFVLASEAAVSERADALRVVLDAFAEEASAANANRAGTADVIARETGLDPELSREVAARADYALAPMTAELVARQQEIADVFVSLGELKAPVRIADAVWDGWEGPPPG